MTAPVIETPPQPPALNAAAARTLARILRRHQERQAELEREGTALAA